MRAAAAAAVVLLLGACTTEPIYISVRHDHTITAQRGLDEFGCVRINDGSVSASAPPPPESVALWSVVDEDRIDLVIANERVTLPLPAAVPAPDSFDNYAWTATVDPDRFKVDIIDGFNMAECNVDGSARRTDTANLDGRSTIWAQRIDGPYPSSLGDIFVLAWSNALTDLPQ